MSIERGRVSWGLDNLPYGVFSPARRAARASGCASATTCSTWPPPCATRCSPPPTLNAFMALGRAAWRDTRARDRRTSSTADLAVDRAAPGPARRGHAAPAVRGRRLRRLLRLAATTPPTSAGSSGPTASRCCPTGGTCRSATTAAPAPSWSPARRSSGPCGQRKAPDEDAPDVTARAGGSTSRPSWASSSARRPTLGEPVADRRRSPSTSSASCCSTTGRPATSRPGSTCRSARSSASRSRPRSRRGSPRWPRSTRPGSTCPARTRRRCDYLRVDGRPGLDIDLEVRAQRRGRQPAAVPHDVLVARPDARPPDRQRRLLRTGDLFASGTISGAGAGPARLVPRAVLGRHRAVPADGATHLPRGRRRGHVPATAPAPAGRITLGEVREPSSPRGRTAT